MLDSGQFMSATTRKGFGGRLYAARLEAGFKVRGTFADALGVSTRTVARWEKGDNSPRNAKAQSEDEQLRDKLDLIAKLVRRTPTYLLTGIEDEQGGLSEVEEYLRTHRVDSKVAEVLRTLPFSQIGQPHPTVKQLKRWCLLLEAGLSDEAQSPDGDKSG